MSVSTPLDDERRERFDESPVCLLGAKELALLSAVSPTFWKLSGRLAGDNKVWVATDQDGEMYVLPGAPREAEHRQFKQQQGLPQ